MPFSDQQISAAHASLEQGTLPTIVVDESQSDEMSQLIINWVRTNITKAKESEHGDPMLILLVIIASNRVEILEKIKKTEETLLKAIIDFKDKEGFTPLARAVQLDCAVGIDWFINNGADSNWRGPGAPNYNLVHLAARKNAIKALERLKAKVYTADEFKQAINLPARTGYTPLALAVLYNCPEAIAWIIENGADSNWRYPGDPNFNLVHLAARYNATQALERSKAKAYTADELKQAINLPNNNGYTPLALAVLNNCPEAIDWLIENGADSKWSLREDPNYNLVHLAARYNATQALERLKAKVYTADEFKQAINLPDKNGNTPLALAVMMDSPEAIDWLIENGADSNWRRREDPNYNLVHLAAGNNAIKALTRLKAKVYTADEFKQAINLPDKMRVTPLALAVRYNHAEAIAWLIENGADINWRHPVDPNFNLVHLAAGSNAIKALTRLKAKVYTADEFKQAINSPNKDGNTPLALAVLKNCPEAIAWFIDNCFVSCSVSEIDSVVKYFKDCFHDLIGRQEVKDGRLRHQRNFEKYFNLLLKYAGICHASSQYMPDFFKDLYEIARSYASLKYPQVYSPLPGILPLYPLASVLVELVDTKTFPVEYLHTYLQTRENINWEIFVAKVAGIEIEAGANAEVIAKLAKQHKYNNIFGKMADEMATAIYKGLKKTWLGISEDYKRDIRECLFELLIEKNSRIIGMLNKPNPIQTSSHSAPASVTATSSSSLFSKPQRPYYISPLALEAIIEELLELTNQRNSCNLRTKEIKEVVSKYIYNPSKQLDVESTSAKRRKLDSPDEREEKPNPELHQPSTPSSSSTASTSSNKRKVERELQRPDNNDDDDENPAAAKKPKSNASGEQERNINPEQEQPSTQAAAENNNNDDGPLSIVPCGLS